MAKILLNPARTTESLIAALRERGGDVRQQIIAHETLARLRAEQAAAADPARVAQLDVDIRFWLGFVDEDVDQPTPVPAAPVGGERAGA